MDVITPYLSNLRLNNNKEKAEIIEPSTIVSKQILYISNLIGLVKFCGQAREVRMLALSTWNTDIARAANSSTQSFDKQKK